MDDEALKTSVQDFWEAASCGEVYASGDELAAQLEEQRRIRYELEPFIPTFARFPEAEERDVLEIGIGMGADHLEWARANPRSLHGVDLTERAVEFTSARLQLAGLESDLRVADAEALPFEDESFDIVYSWGVLHHTPGTAGAIEEVRRVLRPGGTARIMIYHTHSLVGYMLWLRYALLAGNPLQSLTDVYSQHLESPGTKAYTKAQAKQLFSKFSKVWMTTELSPGDLLAGEAGQRHQGRLLSTAKRVWPRGLIEDHAKSLGLFLLIEAER